MNIKAMSLFASFFVAAAVAGMSSSAQGQEVAYWRMEDSTVSESNSPTLDFTLGAAAGFESYDLPGILISDGVSTYANTSVYDQGRSSVATASTISDFAILNDAITIGADFTIEAFVRLDEGGSFAFDNILKGYTFAGSDAGWGFGIDAAGAAGGRLSFFGAPVTGGTIAKVSPNVLPKDTWIHVAAVGTFDDRGVLSDQLSVQLFENYAAVGTPQLFTGTGASGPVLDANPAPYELGANNPFDGFIDELRVSAQALAPGSFLTASGGQPPPPVRAADFGKQWLQDNPFTVMGAALGNDPVFDLTDYQDANLTTVLANNSSIVTQFGVATVASDASVPWIQHWTAEVFTPGSYQPFTSVQKAQVNELVRRGGGIGWMLPDEPEVADFPALAQQADFLRTAHPELLIIVNVESDTGTTFLNNLVTTVQPDVLMFDNFPLNTNGTTDINGWFENLTTIRTVAKASNIPYWGYLQSLTTTGGTFREPSESDLRFNAFSLLTAGYTGLGYFSYDNQASGLEGFFDSAGNKKSVYFLAQSVNPEIAALGQTLRFLTNEDVRFVDGGVSSTPTGLTDWAFGAGGDTDILSVSVDGPSAAGKDGLLGLFTDDDGDRYFMLSNLLHGAGLDAAAAAVDFTITFDSAINSIWRLNRLTGLAEEIMLTSNILNLTLPGGTADLFKFDDGLFPGLAAIPGDFDGDSDVDGFDFLAWQRGFGSTFDATDLSDWESNFGSPGPLSAASGAVGAVPEPASAVMLGLASAGLLLTRSRKRSSV